MKLTSDKKKILVVSDIHLEVEKLDKIIKHEAPDVVVSLGDWFDSHTYSIIEKTEKAAKYLKDYLDNPNYYTLWGNHDIQYFYSNKYLFCTGYSEKNDETIMDVLYPNIASIRDKFQWYIWIDDILCTHAGLHQSHLPPFVKSNEDIDDYLIKAIDQASVAIQVDNDHWLYQVGYYRGGMKGKIGGIIWLDFNYEFKPIGGLKQIVGHTNSGFTTIRSHMDEDSNPLKANNLCIDCGLYEYIIIQNGEIRIGEYIDL